MRPAGKQLTAAGSAFLALCVWVPKVLSGPVPSEPERVEAPAELAWAEPEPARAASPDPSAPPGPLGPPGSSGSFGPEARGARAELGARGERELLGALARDTPPRGALALGGERVVALGGRLLRPGDAVVGPVVVRAVEEGHVVLAGREAERRIALPRTPGRLGAELAAEVARLRALVRPVAREGANDGGTP